MCTVSFVPTKTGVIITSNRDEKSLRQTALPPQQFNETNHQLYYPVDANSNGTWFIVGNSGTVGVLLNGAFEPHVVKEKYRVSRGVILPTVFKQNNVVEALTSFNFTGVENCTILIYQHKKLFEFKWNGEALFMKELNPHVPHIYSSVTLYNAAMIAERVQWFNQWLLQNNQPTQSDAIQFHTSAGKGNTDFGLQMNRNDLMLTVSVTSVFINENEVSLFYKDCVHQQETVQHILLNSLVVC